MSKFTQWITLSLSLAVFVGVASSARAANVFGADDRQAVTSRQYPWKTIGRLSSGCTGTLIGRDLVLTAAHCAIVTGSNNLMYGLTFYPNYIAGESVHSSAVKNARFGGVLYGNSTTSYDWAILRLEDKLGDTYGWMGVDGAFTGSTVTLVGYSGDRHSDTAGAHVDCSIRYTAWDFWYHDCDMTRGASGGPLFVMRGSNNPQIVAVNVGEKRNGGEESLRVWGGFSMDYANMAVPASAFVATVRQMKNE